jgi:hypothetical protein
MTFEEQERAIDKSEVSGRYTFLGGRGDAGSR